ncbi:osmiophilic body protein [Babesia caballi]|uniref:Osmiophilic body protein n=1 Tax=Babesia caballi TaxID=5871 RepID=A0AAV4LYW4_BABCB|nr:osmiophilic body protein [Babesia caballi]
MTGIAFGTVAALAVYLCSGIAPCIAEEPLAYREHIYQPEPLHRRVETIHFASYSPSKQQLEVARRSVADEESRETVKKLVEILRQSTAGQQQPDTIDEYSSEFDNEPVADAAYETAGHAQAGSGHQRDVSVVIHAPVHQRPQPTPLKHHISHHHAVIPHQQETHHVAPQPQQNLGRHQLHVAGPHHDVNHPAHHEEMHHHIDFHHGNQPAHHHTMEHPIGQHAVTPSHIDVLHEEDHSHSMPTQQHPLQFEHVEDLHGAHTAAHAHQTTGAREDLPERAAVGLVDRMCQALIRSPEYIAFCKDPAIQNIIANHPDILDQHRPTATSSRTSGTRTQSSRACATSSPRSAWARCRPPARTWRRICDSEGLGGDPVEEERAPLHEKRNLHHAVLGPEAAQRAAGPLLHILEQFVNVVHCTYLADVLPSKRADVLHHLLDGSSDALYAQRLAWLEVAERATRLLLLVELEPHLDRGAVVGERPVRRPPGVAGHVSPAQVVGKHELHLHLPVAIAVGESAVPDVLVRRLVPPTQPVVEGRRQHVVVEGEGLQPHAAAGTVGGARRAGWSARRRTVVCTRTRYATFTAVTTRLTVNLRLGEGTRSRRREGITRLAHPQRTARVHRDAKNKREGPRGSVAAGHQHVPRRRQRHLQRVLPLALTYHLIGNVAVGRRHQTQLTPRQEVVEQGAQLLGIGHLHRLHVRVRAIGVDQLLQQLHRLFVAGRQPLLAAVERRELLGEEVALARQGVVAPLAVHPRPHLVAHAVYVVAGLVRSAVQGDLVHVRGGRRQLRRQPRPRRGVHGLGGGQYLAYVLHLAEQIRHRVINGLVERTQ